MEEYDVVEYTMEELRETAEKIVPLLREMFGDEVEIECKDDLQVNRATVVIYLQMPEAMVLPAVDVRDLMNENTVEEMADAAAALIQCVLREGKDLYLGSSTKFTRQHVLRTVQLQLLSREKNQVLLDQCPHVKVLDLAGVFCVPVKFDGAYAGMYLIRKENLKDLNLTLGQIYEAAKKNNLRRYRVRVNRMDRMDAQLNRYGQSYGYALDSAAMDDDFWYFVDNWRHTNGAANILIPEVLETLGEKMGRNFYIAVPDQDMMLVCPDYGDTTVPRLFAAWLQEQEPQPQYVSSHLYYYHRRKGLRPVRRF